MIKVSLKAEEMDLLPCGHEVGDDLVEGLVAGLAQVSVLGDGGQQILLAS